MLSAIFLEFIIRWDRRTQSAISGAWACTRKSLRGKGVKYAAIVEDGVADEQEGPEGQQREIFQALLRWEILDSVRKRKVIQYGDNVQIGNLV